MMLFNLQFDLVSCHNDRISPMYFMFKQACQVNYVICTQTIERQKILSFTDMIK